MDKDKIVHAANVLVSAGALAVADSFTGGAATAIGAYFSLREVTKRQSPELQALGQQQVAQLQALTKGTTADDPRYHLPDMILLADLCAADLIATRLDATQTVTVMLDRIAKVAPGSDYATHAYQTCFRQYIEPMLSGIMASPGFANTLMPDFMRAILSAQDRVEQKADQTLALVQLLVTREADTAKALGVRETQLIALAQRVAQDVTDADRAYAELQAAVEEAAKMRALGNAPSNLGQFVDQVMARVLDRAEAGDLDGAEAEAVAAYEEHTAQTERMAEIVLTQARQTRNVDLTVRMELERWTREGGGFGALRAVQDVWYERGRDKGLGFDLGVAITLARACLSRARNGDERGAAQNDLGLALSTLGERESGTLLLQQAVSAFRAALEECTRDRVPLYWATTQNNLGNALRTLGERESDTLLLQQAVTAYRAALEERTRDRVPLEWAMTQNNLGNALSNLGSRESGTLLLQEAVTAYRAALEERTRDRVPLEWAGTQNNLGNALRNLGERESGTLMLQEAVTAYRAALEEYTRERVPLHWAMTQSNLGNVELSFFAKTDNSARLDAAEAHVQLAREVVAEVAPHYLAMTDARLAEIVELRAGLGE